MQCDVNSVVQCVSERTAGPSPTHLRIQSHDEMRMQAPCIQILPSSLFRFVLTPLANLGLVTALDGVDGSS
jgi:hypothetical protein